MNLRKRTFVLFPSHFPIDGSASKWQFIPTCSRHENSGEYLTGTYLQYMEGSRIIILRHRFSPSWQVQCCTLLPLALDSTHTSRSCVQFGFTGWLQTVTSHIDPTFILSSSVQADRDPKSASQPLTFIKPLMELNRSSSSPIVQLPTSPSHNVTSPDLSKRLSRILETGSDSRQQRPSFAPHTLSLFEQNRQPSENSTHSLTTLPSSPGSRFLSPPFTTPQGENPPYRPDAQDRTSLDLHKLNKRKKLLKLLLGSTSSNHQAGAMSSISKAKHPRPVDSADVKSLPSTFQATSSWLPSGYGQTSCFATARTPLHSSTSEALREMEEWGPKHAEAITRALAAIKQRRWTSSGKGRPTRSLTSAFAFGYPVNENLQSAKRSEFFMAGRLSKIKRTSELTQNKSDGTLGPKRDTPASITLRKASRIYQSGEQNDESEAIPSQDNKDGLVASRSTNAISHVSSPVPPAKLQPHPLLESHQPSTSPADNTAAQGGALAGFLGLTNFTNSESVLYTTTSKRHSVAADPALTYTEVCTSPFVMSSTLHRYSQPSTTAFRKPSAIQIQSGGSVHEIIWDQDDSPSSYAASRGSPSRSGRASLAQLALEAIAPLDVTAPDLEPILHTDDDTSTLLPITAFNHIDWSWDNEATEESRTNVGITPIVEELLSAEIALPERTTRPSWNSTYRGLRNRIESFPPLPDRMSSSDWQTPTPTLTNLHDSTAGRPEPGSSPIEASDDDARLSPSVAIDVVPPPTPTPRDPHRTSSVPLYHFSPPRRPSVSGSAGSAIGSNSHVRRRGFSSTRRSSSTPPVADLTQHVFSRRLYDVRDRMSVQVLPRDGGGGCSSGFGVDWRSYEPSSPLCRLKGFGDGGLG